MITIDQAKIDAPNFPRPQAWWECFLPLWIKPEVHPDGTVTLEYRQVSYNAGTHKFVPGEPLPARRQKRADAAVESYLRGCGNGRLAGAIVDEGSP